MHNISIKVKNYKCFGEESGFEHIKRVNLVVGKNNAGKSSLLDVIEIVASEIYEFNQQTYRAGVHPEIIFGDFVAAENIHRVFPDAASGGSIPVNHRMYGNQIIGRFIKWSKFGRNQNGTQLLACEDDTFSPPLVGLGEYAKRLAASMHIPIEGKSLRRVLAERDISPEVDNNNDISIRSNGQGITTAIQRFINRSNLPSKIVEDDILSALNEIFAHDAHFTKILCQKHEDDHWEIFLEEEGKGRISLSRSGSGLKTVISVLVNLFLVPEMEGKSLNAYIFLMEEIENNIHPALLRRLANFIYHCSIKNDFIYFVTTHSNVLIDLHSRQEDAQIIHVVHSGGASVCKTVKTYIDNHGVLDDLDVRASDLLQANGIIWVEGPSDRIYLNRWIDLWSDGRFKEGANYQCIFYGGRLLAHLDADVQGAADGTVSILNANRNAIILMDSDFRDGDSALNSTKIRLCDEFEAIGSLSWVTSGREIENYISAAVVASAFMVGNAAQVGQFESFFNYLDGVVSGEGERLKNKKPFLAEKLAPFMSRENMSLVLDLDARMSAICAEIEAWNS